MDDIHKGLLKKFHTLCSKAGLADWEKRAILEAYDVESSKDLQVHDLIDIFADLGKRLDPRVTEMNKLRKQVMGSIGGWLNLTRQENNAAIIKGIACRVTGHEDFNKIPVERLRNVYNLFLKKQKDYKVAEEIAIENWIEEVGNVQLN